MLSRPLPWACCLLAAVFISWSLGSATLSTKYESVLSVANELHGPVEPSLTYGECKRQVDHAIAMLSASIDRLTELAERIDTEWRPAHLPAASANDRAAE